MKIRNVSKTVVGIGIGKTVLPDEEIVLPEGEAMTPAILALASAGILSLDNSDEKARSNSSKATVKESDEDSNNTTTTEAEDDTEASSAPKKAGRKPKAKTEGE